ncbi:MAG: PHP domain-containing protein [Ruminococcaceae bacterium]|nr:PHP domain-containing protein [Oscillospiraceae bacterium]
MKFTYDHDLHIHSNLSACSNDPEQTAESILAYAKKRKLKRVCITDHFWDEAVPGASDWYLPQNYKHISRIKPLPQAEGVQLLFGCEAELDKNMSLSVSEEKYDLFDFIVVATTHMHRVGFTVDETELKTPERRADAWIRRLDAVLDMDLPFHKVGIAHLTCKLIAPEKDVFLKTLRAIPVSEMKRLFTKAARLGAGIELNYGAFKFADEEAALLPYRIAKECGCKFYCGSDAHEVFQMYAAGEVFQKAINLLDLREEDKMK